MMAKAASEVGKQHGPKAGAASEVGEQHCWRAVCGGNNMVDR